MPHTTLHYQVRCKRGADCFRDCSRDASRIARLLTNGSALLAIELFGKVLPSLASGFVAHSVGYSSLFGVGAAVSRLVAYVWTVYMVYARGMAAVEFIFAIHFYTAITATNAVYRGRERTSRLRDETKVKFIS